MLGVGKFRLKQIVIYLFFLGFLTTRSYGFGIPPSILVQPLGISVQNGGTATFTVVTAISLSGTLSFNWQVLTNGQFQSISTGPNVTIVNGQTNLLGIVGLLPLSALTVKNISSAGTYRVQISNNGGTATSSNATLVILPITVSNVVNIVSTGLRMTTSGLNLQFSAPTGSNVVVEASTDLQHWTPVVTNLVTSGGISVTDTLAKNYLFRYYRAHTK